MNAKADLHVHSRYSNRPGEWFLRRIGAPESYTEPRDVYATCREKGMTFVTISDHNSIDGALEIAHLPGTFLSDEVTTYFPEDGCKIHCLVLGITEGQFRDIQEVRKSVYDFRDYLFENDIVHSVAHPLFSVNGKLTIEHLEKLLVLFKRFEGINGARDPRAGNLVRAILDNLTPPMMEEMAERHDIDPRDPEPWRKWLTAGSDDHGGLYLASAHTVTPPAQSVGAYLRHLAKGRHWAAGEAGSSLKLARTFYSISYRYYKDRLLGDSSAPGDLFTEMFTRLLQGDPPGTVSRADRLRLFIGQLVRPRKKVMGEIDRTVADELVRLVSITEGGPTSSLERRCFQIASRLSHQISYAALRKSTKYLSRGKLTESLQSLSSLGPMALCIAPYLAAFHTQHKDESLFQAVARHFPATRLLRRKSDRKVWFTDTFEEANGVASTVRATARLAKQEDKSLFVVTSLKAPPENGDVALRNFEPVGDFKLPEYEEQRLSLPPFLDILEFCERECISEVIISTPGPMGLVGLATAGLLGLRSVGIYHTDFPLHVRHLTDSPALESMTWSYMRWFYERMDLVYVPSHSYQQRLEASGFDPGKLRLLPRGVDLERFHPKHRSQDFWGRYNLGDGLKLLYVGRISREKNLDTLLAGFMGLLADGVEADLVLVGDGPYLEELAGRYREPRILFTGFLESEKLPVAYASSDVFVFPSTAETFGHAVLEAQASGLPALVSDAGACREIILPGRTGLTVDLARGGALTRAMAELARDPERRRVMGEKARDHACGRPRDALLTELWQEAGSDPDCLWERHGTIRREAVHAAADLRGGEPLHLRMP